MKRRTSITEWGVSLEERLEKMRKARRDSTRESCGLRAQPSVRSSYGLTREVAKVATAARSPLVGRQVATKPTGILTAALQAGTRRYHNKEPAAEKPHELIVFSTEVHRSGEFGYIIHTTDGVILIALNEGILDDGATLSNAKLKVTGWPLSDGVWLVNKFEHSATP
ncbi:hypothetical protein FOZ62_019690 [Perkinsus olseni]|uniref:Uncharacterized protein n=1 Tax=Perkinsus olseni TaxID=32597 RepID=A0A7J6SUA6_PEROL|nr:hypothetical protein FOZ62_019690 [Perkinsus olseni]